MANSTLMFSGIDPEGRNSSKVLRPPGGGSSLGPFHADNEPEPVKEVIKEMTEAAPPAPEPTPAPVVEKVPVSVETPPASVQV